MTIIIPKPGESLAEYKARFAEADRRLLQEDEGPLRPGVANRSLNPCGQEGDGTFAAGNTCAAGGGGNSGRDVPEGRVKSSEYGMRYAASNEAVVAKARELSDEQWNTHPVQSLPHGTLLEANEELLKTAPIEKVVSGREPFREGYVTKLFRDGKGRLHVVDGHHRVAMYHALKKDMPVRILDEKDVESLRIPEVDFQATSDSDAFAAARDRSAHPGFLSSHTPRELDAFDKFTAEGGKVGYMIDPKTGDFGNLFNNGGTKGAGKRAITEAIKGGAKTLDCFDGFLPSFYAKAGWTPVAKYKFNDDYAPASWDYATHGRPDVVVMAYTGGDRSRIAERYGTFPAYVPLSEYSTEEFDDAKRRARELSEAADAANPGGQAGQSRSARPTVDGGADSRHRARSGPAHLGHAGRRDASDPGSLDARGLNPCGQEGDGTFAAGNTCAAGGGLAAVGGEATRRRGRRKKSAEPKSAEPKSAEPKSAEPKSAEPELGWPDPADEARSMGLARVKEAIGKGFAAESDTVHLGDAQTEAARRAIFTEGVKPSEVLRLYGWTGDGADIDGTNGTPGLAGVIDALPETPNQKSQRKTSIAGFLVGMGNAIQAYHFDHPDVREIALRVQTRESAAAEAEAEFRAQWEKHVKKDSDPNPLALTRAEFELALAEAKMNAQAPVAYHDARRSRITIIVDNLNSSAQQEKTYVSGGMSAASPLHTGYHEMTHAAHMLAIRKEIGLRTTGGDLSDIETARYLAAREGKIRGVMRDMLDRPEKWKITQAVAGSGADEIQEHVVKEITRASSFYGATNPTETIAEYATGVALGGVEPTPAMDELYEHISGLSAPKPPEKITAMSRGLREYRNMTVQVLTAPPPILSFGPQDR